MEVFFRGRLYVGSYFFQGSQTSSPWDLLQPEVSDDEAVALQCSLLTLERVPHFPKREYGDYRRGVFVGRPLCGEGSRYGPRAFFPLLQLVASNQIAAFSVLLAMEGLGDEVALAAMAIEPIITIERSGGTLVSHVQR